MGHPSITLSIAVFAPLVIYVVYQRFFSPLAGIPGPFIASLSRIWLTQLSWRGGTHKVMMELHRKHGKYVRIAPDELSIADPQTVKTIYGVGSRFRKSEWYSVWQGRRTFDLFPERNEKVHGRQRSLVSRFYSMDSLRSMESYVIDTVDVFFARMEEFRKAGQGMDLGAWIQFFAFDIIGEITFSKRFGFLEIPEAYPPQPEEFELIEYALRSAAWIGQVPFVYWIHDYLKPWIGNHLGLTARNGSISDFTTTQIEKRQARESDHSDILTQLLAKSKERPDDLDLSAVQSMASANVFAGSDTTAASTRAVVDYLLRNPECEAKLVAEIDERKADGKLSSPVQLQEALDMPYLQAVLYEAMRMHPASGMSLPRVVPPAGLSIQDGKRFLPQGIVVGTNPWVLHRDKSVFGEDADHFNPDRWMKGNNCDMHRFFFSFGSGSRMCLGKNISWMEMSLLIPTLFDRYKLELVEPNKPLSMHAWWIVIQKGLHVKMQLREEASA